MNYAEHAKAKGIKLELSIFRDHWRKSLNGKMHYLRHPQTKAGYETALEEWYLTKAQIDGQRNNVETYNHHLALFNSVLEYWNAFGTPRSERQLQQSVIQFVEMIQKQMKQPVLPERIQVKDFLNEHQAFNNEFNRPLETEFIAFTILVFGSIKYQLPDKWDDRIARMTPTQQTKEPQTIAHWIEMYLNRVKSRVGKTIVERTALNRGYKLSHFKKYADGQSHVSVILDDYVTQYHETLDSEPLSKVSKEGYFATFKMFVRWCGRQTACELTTPTSLDSRDFSFREPYGTGRKRQEKKKLLWAVDEFKTALTLPEPYRTYCLLMLNCGFRHVDIAHLQNNDIVGNRIVIQRQKLNQQDSAPVISYLLWDSTIAALRNYQSSELLVFGDVENSLKLWWRRNRQSYGLEKRLDYLRKTGSTIVAQHDEGLDSMYLGESLSEISKKHYSFNDGDPCSALDRAIAYLGSKFGLCQPPAKTVELTPEIIEGLKNMGIAV